MKVRQLQFILWLIAITVPTYSYSDDAMKEFLRAYSSYIESIANTASKKLDKIYPLVPKDFRENIARSKLFVSAQDGLDRRCSSGLTTGYLKVHEKKIVLCAEDLSAAVDLLLAIQIVTISTFVENVKVFHLNLRLPPTNGALEKMKGQVAALTLFYVRANGESKNSRFMNNKYGPSPCFGWQAAAFVIEGKALSNCYRMASDDQANSKTATWVVSVILRFGNMMSEYVGKGSAANQKALEQAMDIMDAMRTGLFDALIYFVVAHELGHLISNNGSVGESSSELKDEIAADTFAINAMRNEAVYANVVPYLSIALHWLWQEAAKSSRNPTVDFNRVESITKVAFCGENPVFSTSIFVHSFIPMMQAFSYAMCKDVSRQ